jgi:superfamily II DNA or RNA helicase
MHQWYANLRAAFPDVEIGLLGGGSKDRTPILVSTYDSAAIQAETLGNLYGFIVFDECHHLPGEFYRTIAEYSIAPYRLGLTATPERSDGKHADLTELIGAEVYRKAPEELSGLALAEHKIIQKRVKLSPAERDRYDELIQTRNTFLKDRNIMLGSLKGWQIFVRESARSQAGRRAMLAHREARAIAFGTEGKLQVLADLLAEHFPERTLIFTDDNATVYRISLDFLIPAITHQTPVKERHEILQKFREGTYPTIITSRVLNEGVDVPEARIAIVLSGTGSTREYVQRLGRILRKGTSETKLALLYEVIAEETAEENVSRRRSAKVKAKPPSRQLELVPMPEPWQAVPRAAEASPQWNEPDV